MTLLFGQVSAPEGATVPALGLSNKPVFGPETGQGDKPQRYPSERYSETTFKSLPMSRKSKSVVFTENLGEVCHTHLH